MWRWNGILRVIMLPVHEIQAKLLQSQGKMWRKRTSSCLHKVHQGAAIPCLEMRNISSGLNVWIGLTRIGDDIAWWDGTRVAYTNWGSSPYNDLAPCIRMRRRRSYEWNDEDCFDDQGYICEFENAKGTYNYCLVELDVPTDLPPCKSSQIKGEIWSSFKLIYYKE